jgi:DNA-binding MarR family transcriptional regulator
MVGRGGRSAAPRSEFPLSMPAANACPVCKLERVRAERVGDWGRYVCEACGAFSLTRDAEIALPDLVKSRRSSAAARHWIRRHQSTDRPPTIKFTDLAQIVETPPPSAPMQAELLLAFLGRAAEEETGRWVEQRTERFCAEAGVSEAGLVPLLEGLKAEGLVEWRHRPAGRPGVRARLTLAGWRAIEGAKPANSGGAAVASVSQGIKIFVSHTSADEELVRRLVELLKAALRLPASEILCSSLGGHRLEGGTDIETAIREAVGSAGVLVAVVTPRSLESVYVLFELGARWHSGLPFIPLLAPGIGTIPRPLDRFNGLLLNSREDVQQLISELASRLNQNPARPEAYEYHVGRVVDPELARENVSAAKAPEELPPQAVTLMLLIQQHGGVLDRSELLQLGGFSIEMTRFLIETLEGRRLIEETSSGFELSRIGRAYLYKKGLLK